MPLINPDGTNDEAGQSRVQPLRQPTHARREMDCPAATTGEEAHGEARLMAVPQP